MSEVNVRVLRESECYQYIDRVRVRDIIMNKVNEWWERVNAISG